MNYDTASDYEINAAVAKALGFEVGMTDFPDGINMPMAVSGGQAKPLPNYCDSPTDAWPIITENKISIDWVSDDQVWSAIGNDGSIFCCTNYQHKNALRAACIVYLIMMET